MPSIPSVSVALILSIIAKPYQLSVEQDLPISSPSVFP